MSDERTTPAARSGPAAAVAVLLLLLLLLVPAYYAAYRWALRAEKQVVIHSNPLTSPTDIELQPRYTPDAAWVAQVFFPAHAFDRWFRPKEWSLSNVSVSTNISGQAADVEIILKTEPSP